MKRNLRLCLTGLSATLMLLSSCVRDNIPPCPPLQVNITVKDKNYFNVDKVEFEDRLADNLPLRDYVPTLHYRLSRLKKDGSCVPVEEKEVFRVEGDAPVHTVTFGDELPHGTYVLTVWGGLQGGADPLDADGKGITFHPEGREGADVYMTNDTIVYDAWHNRHTAELERTKGKLIVQVTGLPDEVCRRESGVNGLFGRLAAQGFAYSGLAEVKTRHEWTPGTDVVTKTVLAPSVREKGSTLNMNFHEGTGQKTFTPEDVAITMERNVLTVLKYVYEGGDKFSIYILVNGDWEKIHGMDID